MFTNISTNKAFDKVLEYSIHSKLSNNSLDLLFAVIMNAFFAILILAYVWAGVFYYINVCKDVWTACKYLKEKVQTLLRTLI